MFIEKNCYNIYHLNFTRFEIVINNFFNEKTIIEIDSFSLMILAISLRGPFKFCFFYAFSM